MKRGEIWVVSAAGDYTRKPRPMVIVQSENFDETESVTMCGFTTEPSNTTLIRLPVLPNATNGLRQGCNIMIDKISTVPKAKLDRRIGRLEEEDMSRVNRALLIFLGLAGETGSALQPAEL